MEDFYKYEKKYSPPVTSLAGDSALIHQLFPSHKAPIPEDLLLDVSNRTPGFFVGGLNQFENGTFIGIPPDADGNIIVVGGNGSGKSASLAKPTLRTWPGPIFAIDVKGELATAYEAFFESSLRQGKLIRPFIVLDAMNPDSLSYDPFWWLLKDGHQELIGNVWEIIYAINPKQPDNDQPFWVETEQSVLAAALYHFLNLGLSFSETMCHILALTLTDLCQELTISKDPITTMTSHEQNTQKTETARDTGHGRKRKSL